MVKSSFIKDNNKVKFLRGIGYGITAKSRFVIIEFLLGRFPRPVLLALLVIHPASKGGDFRPSSSG
jgi:hypothetical protein